MKEIGNKKKFKSSKKKHAQIIATEVKKRDALNKKNRDEIKSLKAQLEDCKEAFDAYKNVAILSLKIHQEKIAQSELDRSKLQNTIDSFKDNSAYDSEHLDSSLILSGSYLSDSCEIPEEITLNLLEEE